LQVKKPSFRDNGNAFIRHRIANRFHYLLVAVWAMVVSVSSASIICRWAIYCENNKEGEVLLWFQERLIITAQTVLTGLLAC
jgi:hypothetical protein